MRPHATSPLPTGPMVRMLRRMAKGKRVAVMRTVGPLRGHASILAGLVARGLIEGGGAADPLPVYRLTSAGFSALDCTRSAIR